MLGHEAAAAEPVDERDAAVADQGNLPGVVAAGLPLETARQAVNRDGLSLLDRADPGILDVELGQKGIWSGPLRERPGHDIDDREGPGRAGELVGV